VFKSKNEILPRALWICVYFRLAIFWNSAQERAEQAVRVNTSAGGYWLRADYTNYNLYAVTQCTEDGVRKCAPKSTRVTRSKYTRDARTRVWVREHPRIIFAFDKGPLAFWQEADTCDAVIAIKIFRDLMQQSTMRGHYTVIRSTNLQLVLMHNCHAKLKQPEEIRHRVHVKTKRRRCFNKLEYWKKNRSCFKTT